MSTARVAAAGVLAGLFGLHLLWAAGSPWPARSRRSLALAVVGVDRMPPRRPTLMVAASLGAAAVVATRCRRASLPRLGLIAAFALRAFLPSRAVDLVRRPDPRSSFARWNARCFRPLTALIAALLAAG